MFKKKLTLAIAHALCEGSKHLELRRSYWEHSGFRTSEDDVRRAVERLIDEGKI